MISKVAFKTNKNQVEGNTNFGESRQKVISLSSNPFEKYLTEVKRIELSVLFDVDQKINTLRQGPRFCVRCPY